MHFFVLKDPDTSYGNYQGYDDYTGWENECERKFNELMVFEFEHHADMELAIDALRELKIHIVTTSINPEYPPENLNNFDNLEDFENLEYP